MIIFVLPKIIKIEEFDCSTQYGACDEWISKEFEILKGKNYSQTKKYTLLIIKNFIFVDDYLVQYKFPNGIKVNLSISKPVYCLKKVNENIYDYINSTGMVVRVDKECSLPVVETENYFPNMGEEIKEDILNALTTVSLMNLSFGVSNGKILNNYLQINMPQGYNVLFPLDRDSQVLVGSLKLIISRLNENASDTKIDSGIISVIDLRYTNPVLR